MRTWDPAPPVGPSLEERAAWRDERERARKAQRRVDVMSPRERHLAIIADLREAAAARDREAAEATAAGDTERAASLRENVAELRRLATRKEQEVPSIDLTTPAEIQTRFAEQTAKIRADLDALAADDGKEASWKSRERRRLIDALDTARQTADSAMTKWAAAAEREARKALAKDTRDPTSVAQDMGAEMMAARLAKTILSTGSAASTEAGNKLLPRARAMLSEGRSREALAYARAAAMHGAVGADSLVAQLERDYEASWPGHKEAAEALATVEAQMDSFHTASHAEAARAAQAAIRAAEAIGDVPDVGLSERAVADSIAAKHGAFVTATAEGKPYVDPTR